MASRHQPRPWSSQSLIFTNNQHEANALYLDTDTRSGHKGQERTAGHLYEQEMKSQKSAPI